MAEISAIFGMSETNHGPGQERNSRRQEEQDPKQELFKKPDKETIYLKNYLGKVLDGQVDEDHEDEFVHVAENHKRFGEVGVLLHAADEALLDQDYARAESAISHLNIALGKTHQSSSSWEVAEDEEPSDILERKLLLMRERAREQIIRQKMERYLAEKVQAREIQKGLVGVLDQANVGRRETAQIIKSARMEEIQANVEAEVLVHSLNPENSLNISKPRHSAEIIESLRESRNKDAQSRKPLPGNRIIGIQEKFETSYFGDISINTEDKDRIKHEKMISEFTKEKGDIVHKYSYISSESRAALEGELYEIDRNIDLRKEQVKWDAENNSSNQLAQSVNNLHDLINLREKIVSSIKTAAISEWIDNSDDSWFKKLGPRIGRFVGSVSDATKDKMSALADSAKEKFSGKTEEFFQKHPLLQKILEKVTFKDFKEGIENFKADSNINTIGELREYIATWIKAGADKINFFNLSFDKKRALINYKKEEWLIKQREEFYRTRHAEEQRLIIAKKALIGSVRFMLDKENYGIDFDQIKKRGGLAKDALVAGIADYKSKDGLKGKAISLKNSVISVLTPLLADDEDHDLNERVQSERSLLKAKINELSVEYQETQESNPYFARLTDLALDRAGIILAQDHIVNASDETFDRWKAIQKGKREVLQEKRKLNSSGSENVSAMTAAIMRNAGNLTAFARALGNADQIRQGLNGQIADSDPKVLKQLDRLDKKIRKITGYEDLTKNVHVQGSLEKVQHSKRFLPVGRSIEMNKKLNKLHDLVKQKWQIIDRLSTNPSRQSTEGSQRSGESSPPESSLPEKLRGLNLGSQETQKWENAQRLRRRLQENPAITSDDLDNLYSLFESCYNETAKVDRQIGFPNPQNAETILSLEKYTTYKKTDTDLRQATVNIQSLFRESGQLNSSEAKILIQKFYDALLEKRVEVSSLRTPDMHIEMWLDTKIGDFDPKELSLLREVSRKYFLYRNTDEQGKLSAGEVAQNREALSNAFDFYVNKVGSPNLGDMPDKVTQALGSLEAIEKSGNIDSGQVFSQIRSISQNIENARREWLKSQGKPIPVIEDDDFDEKQSSTPKTFGKDKRNNGMRTEKEDASEELKLVKGFSYIDTFITDIFREEIDKL